jgi:hypothetical protein
VASQRVVDVSWSPAPVADLDPDGVIATLHAERSRVHGGHNHLHAAVNCGFCQRAAATYR